MAERAPGRVGEALRLYKNLSGAFRDYTFFAPNVASDVRAGFLLEDARGGTSFVAFRARNREVAFKYNSIIAVSMRDERGRDLFARSWAAFMLGSQPAAATVTVAVESFVLPPMPEYRAGLRPEWRTLYVGTFARQRPPP